MAFAGQTIKRHRSQSDLLTGGLEDKYERKTTPSSRVEDMGHERHLSLNFL